MAIGGLVAIGVWLLAVCVVLLVVLPSLAQDGSSEVPSGGQISITALRPGDCVNDVREGRYIRSLPTVPCDEPHEAEAYAHFALTDGLWPGNDRVFELAEEGCVDHLYDYSPIAYDDPEVEIIYTHPTRSTWRTGAREVVCVAQFLDGPRTGSIRTE